MVGPWLFWLGPMISVCYASPSPLAWHWLFAFLFWHCDDFP